MDKQSALRQSEGLQAVVAMLDSTPFRVLLLLAVGFLAAYQTIQFSLNLLLFVSFALIVILCLLKINWAICLLIFLSPFHYAIKELSSSVAIDVWREVFLLVILWCWLLQILLRKRPLLPNNLLSFVLIAYLLWGIVEIFNSADMLVGMAGFRYMFSFLPLYFITISTVTDEADIKRFVKAILASGVIVGAIAIVQFVLVSLLAVVEKGKGIDFARKYAPTSYLAVGIPWDRANSILVGPNELGVFLAVCLTLMYGYYLSKENRSRHPWLVIVSMVITGVGLLVSMSRSSMLGFVVACVALGILKRRPLKPLFALLVVAIVLLVVAPFYLLPLFIPVFSFSDLYFTATLSGAVSSEMVWGAPLVGHGYGLTPSVSEKLGIEDPSVLLLGGVDIYVVQSIAQIGLIGFSLFFLGWVLFLKDAYRGAKQANGSEFQRDTAAGIYAALLGIMVTSAHVAAWEYVSFAASYYMLGGIGTWISAGAAGRITGYPWESQRFSRRTS